MKIVSTAIMVLAFVCAAGGAARAHEHGHEGMAAAPAAASAEGLTETGQVLKSADFARAANAYKIAEEMPKTIDALYCWCKCKENPKLHHKTLLTCYTSDHASKCGICMHEAEMAADLTKQGKSIPEIRAAVDAFYKAKEEKEKQEKK